MRGVFGVRPLLIALLLLVLLCTPVVVLANVPTGGQTIALTERVHPFTFPDGGRVLFPLYRLVALYGTPNAPELGVLGEQDAAASITRVKDLAAAYQPLVTEHVMPALEIITTVASASPTQNGDYSYPIDTSVLASWIKQARAAGVYVVLDLQPGRTDFLTQAKSIEAFLAQPNVGLALDPEWRLGPNEVPLVQIGSVSISEVNATAQWLANLTKGHRLPQKLFLLHQFRLDMLPNRDQLDISHPELAYAAQMDGQGSQEAKLATWQAIIANSPANLHFGWKNFYKKDATLRSPADTIHLTPEPWYISYQ